MTTAHAVRAKRARELQDALQDAIRVEHAMRAALAPVVNKWRTAYKRLEKAAGRFNAMVEPLDPDLAVNTDEVPSPAVVLEIVRGAVNLEVVPVLKQLRAIGPELRTLPTGKQIRKVKKRERVQAKKASVAQERVRLEQAVASLERRLADPAELEMYRADRNLMNKTEGKPQFTVDEYVEVTRGYLDGTRELLRKLGAK